MANDHDRTDDEKKAIMEERVSAMLNCYIEADHHGFEQNWRKVNRKKVFELAREARMYCFADELRDAEIVFSRRNLVNITMNKRSYYDAGKWQTFTGVDNDESGYDVLHARNPETFPPMIGAYCVTPVFSSDDTVDDRHVFSSVGVALDARAQADFKILDAMNSEKRLGAVIGRVRRAYELFFACLDDTGLKKAALCILGSVAFVHLFKTDLCKNNDYLVDVWWEVVRPFVDERKEVVDFYLLAVDQKEFDTTRDTLGFTDKQFKFAGSFPENAPLSDETSQVLFQNAWDPHSVVGNGHSGDGSLDGYVGRSTIVAPLAFPGTNVFMRAPRTVGIALSTPKWKSDGEHAVTGHGTYRGERKFVKLVCLTPTTVNGKNISNENRRREIKANATVQTLIDELKNKDDHRANCFLAATVERVSVSGDGLDDPIVPAWARSWIAEYERHVTFVGDVSTNREYAFLIMRDVSTAVPLWRWWRRTENLSTFRDRALMIAQIVDALEALADAKITHRDFHWQNVVVETLDTPVEVTLGGVRGFLPKHRPVVFDWDRAVVGDRHDRHYDLIGFYKNLTQNYGPTEQFFWRLLLHPFFEATFDAFPSLAFNHVHHANPCVVGFDDGEFAKQLAAEYRWKTEPEIQRGLPPRPWPCEKTWWFDVPTWTAFPHKPSHGDVARRVLEGFITDAPKSPPRIDTPTVDLESLTNLVDEKTKEADAETKRAKEAWEEAREAKKTVVGAVVGAVGGDGESLEKLAEWIEEASRRARIKLTGLADAALAEEDQDQKQAAAADILISLSNHANVAMSEHDLSNMLVGLRKKIEAEEEATKRAASAVALALETSHELERAMAPVKTFFGAVYVSVGLEREE